MKIIYDNIIFSHVTQGGVSNYWFELSKALMQKKEDEVIPLHKLTWSIVVICSLIQYDAIQDGMILNYIEDFISRIVQQYSKTYEVQHNLRHKTFTRAMQTLVLVLPNPD